jgi:hypothetical protein
VITKIRKEVGLIKISEESKVAEEAELVKVLQDSLFDF